MHLDWLPYSGKIGRDYRHTTHHCFNLYQAKRFSGIDTWDYQWVFANWVEGRMSILPAVNMITNVGFDSNATHTTGASDLANLARNPIAFPLTHPLGVFRNIQADQFSEHKCFRVPLMKRVLNQLAGWLR